MFSRPARKSYHTAERFLQTLLLQLRRKPEINVRIMLPLTWTVGADFGEWEANKTERSIKVFIQRVWEDITLTRRPRPLTDYIRRRITLVVPDLSEEQTAYWKGRFRWFERDIEWDTATQKELLNVAATEEKLIDIAKKVAQRCDFSLHHH
jgi:hypothetical protein